MIALAIIVAYLLIGYVSGRLVMHKRLGTSKRYERPYGQGKYMTDDFDAAVIWAMLTLFFWPIAGLMFSLIHTPTPHERGIEKQKQQVELEARYKQLEKEVLQFGKNL